MKPLKPQRIISLAGALVTLVVIHVQAQDITFEGGAGCNGAAVSGTWEVPCGVTSITVELYGAGGGGGGGADGSNGGILCGENNGGGGGGGGAYTTLTITVTPGSSFTYSTGSGGCGGSGGGECDDGDHGGNGANSTFTGTDAGGTAVNLSAGGGQGGRRGNSNGPVGGPSTGGVASGGTTNTAGGAGGGAQPEGTRIGGVGGDGAGPLGGAGGTAGVNTSTPGATYGGGGGGGGDSNGGNGAPGAIFITLGGTATLEPAPTVVSTPPTCSEDGSSAISDYDPAATYTFTPAGPTVAAGGAIAGMDAGTSYTVVSEIAGCQSEVSDPFSNTASTGVAPTPTIASTPPTCTSEGGSTISNYNAVMTYTFTPAGPTAGAGGVISGMTVGTSYTVIANDGPCISDASDPFSNDEQLPGPDITITGTLTHCEGGTTTITGSGGVSYLWDDPAASTTASIDVTSGTYTVIGTDGNGCTGNASATVTESAPFAITFTGPLSHCPGGTTTVTASGGDTYTWSTGDNTAAAELTAGTHTVTATDVDGCISSDDVTITEVSAPVADFTVVDACAGENVEFIDASTIAIGTITDWDWDFGDGSGSNEQNPTHDYGVAGTFDVTLTVSAGSCSHDTTFQATSFPVPTADFSTDNVCLGDVADFTDNSSVTGSAIAQWAWDFDGEGNDVVQDASFTFTAPGTYSVTLAVVTSDFCADTHTEEVTVYPAPEATFAAAAVCEGEATSFENESTVSSGIITAQVWDMGDGTGASVNASPTYTYAEAGVYPVTLGVTSSFGCIATVTQDVTVHSLPDIDATHTDVLCAGQINGTATASATGGSAPYDYVWSNAQQSTTTTIENLGPGPYTVSITDALGCSSDTTVTVEQPLPINVQLVAGDDTCGRGNGAVQAVMLGGTAPFDYVWSAISDSSHLYSEDVPPSGWNTMLTPGEYSVVVTDAGGCEAEGEATVGLIPAPVAAFSTRSKPEELKDPSVSFFNESIGATLYEWHLGNSDVSMQEHPVHDYDSSGTYLVMLIARNEPRYGCADTTYRYVEVDPLFTFYIPNAFTPDGDDVNDSWGPKGGNYEYESYNVQVYDRWGKLVWQTDNPEKLWNGTDQRSLQPCPQGLYVYQFLVKQFNTFEPVKRRGSITLYRNR